VLHGVIHFDTKLWRTLPKLAFRPGTLTREYVHGKRARYVSLLAIFLFTVFLMFFVFSFTGGPNFTPDLETSADEAVQRAEERLADAVKAREEAETEVAQARRDLNEARAEGDQGEIQKAESSLAREVGRLTRDGRRAAEAQAALEAARAARLEELEQAKVELAEAAKDAQDAGVPLAAGGFSKAADAVERELQQAQPGDKAKLRVGVTADEDVVFGVSGKTDVANLDFSGDKSWQEQWRDAVRRGDVTVNFGNPELNKKVLKKLENPDLILYKLQQTAYKFSFLLVPISLPFVALLFLWKRGLTLFDHTVFVLYSLSFVSLAFIAIALLVMSPFDASGLIAAIVVLGLPTHAFFQLKGAYALGWFSALWRTTLLLFFAMIALMLFFTAIVFLGLVG